MAADVGGALPELANVRWRRRVDDRSLRRVGRLWTLSTVAHTLPFVAGALVLGLASPILLPFAVLCLAHAWAIPELYAVRGARVVRRVGGERGGPRARREGSSETSSTIGVGSCTGALG